MEFLKRLERIFLLVSLGFSLGCGARLPYQLKESLSNPENLQSTTPVLMSGQLQILDGSVVKLEEIKDHPIVISFGSQSCGSCKAEVAQFLSSLQAKGFDIKTNPNQVHVFSVMVNGPATEAMQFQQETSAPWWIAYGDNQELFHKYCNTVVIPCTVVQTPDKGIVLQAAGDRPYAQIEKLTGVWYSSTTTTSGEGNP